MELAGRLAPYALIAVVVVVANGPYVSGAFDPNPLVSVSGLAAASKLGVLAGHFTTDRNVGMTSQALGHLAALDLLHGKIPWWNPYEGIGAPLAGEMQAAALFPPTLLLALPAGQLFFHLVLEAVAGMSTYRLLTRLGTSGWIAMAGGCAFALNGTYALLANATINPVALLPLLLLGVERARAASEEGRGGSFGLVAVALALAVYAGFPETAYLEGVFAVLWALLRVRGLGRGPVVAYLRKVAAGAVAGALLAAPIVVAFGDYLPGSYLGPNSGGLNAQSVPHAGFGALFFPYLAGPVLGFGQAGASTTLIQFWISVGGYLTTSLLVLGLVGLWSRRLRALRIGLAAWVVAGLGRAYGVGFFTRLFSFLPGSNHVGTSRYVPPSVELACVVLAFLAIDDLRRRQVPRWFVAAAMAAAAGCALWAVGEGRALVRAAASVPQAHDWLVWSLAWGFSVLAAIGAAAIVLRGRWRTLLLAGLVVLDAGAMFVVPELAAPRNARIDTAFVRWAQSHVGTERLFTLGGLLYPNYGSYFQVSEADISDIPMPEAYARAIQHHLDPGTLPDYFDGVSVVSGRGGAPHREEPPIRALATSMRQYEAIGVAYVATYAGPDAAAVAALGLTRVYADRFAEVFRLPHPSPLYSAEALGRPGQPSPAAREPASGSSGPADCTLSGERIDSVTADCRRPAILIRRELAMPGWSATAGGSPRAVQRHGPLFQSVMIGRGRTVVRFAFVPPYEGQALWAFVAGLGALAAGWVLAHRSLRALLHRPGRRRSGPAEPGG